MNAIAEQERRTTTRNQLDQRRKPNPHRPGTLRRRGDSSTGTGIRKTDRVPSKPSGRTRSVRPARPAKSARQRRDGLRRATQPRAQVSRQPKSQPQARFADDKPWLSVPLCLVYFSYVIGLGCVVIFGLDAATGLLFRRASLMFDIVFSICGAALVWLAFDAHKVARK